MANLSSPFLPKCSFLINSPISSFPPLLIQFNISSIKTHENYNKTANQTTPIVIPNTKIPFLHPTSKTTLSKPDKKQTPFLVSVLRLLDEFICNFIDPPLRPSIDPNHVLSGNFAPVNELPPTPCHVTQGKLPPSVSGVYIRNGPNPQFIPRGPYHLFDGDGMLHALTVTNGKVTFCSRFVKTYKYALERENGAPVILNIFSAFNGLTASLARCTIAVIRAVTRQYDPTRGIGVANTSLALFGGNLFALGESDLPYALKLTPAADVVTLGRHESFGGEGFGYVAMTAHPKIDADSGEAFAFRHSIAAPFLTYFRINADGEKQTEIPIFSLNQASMIHDFAISENFAIFPDTQIVIRPWEILRGRPPLRVDAAKVPRLGIIPRYAEDDKEMWWVEVPGFNMIHAVNAWEEDGGDTVVMVGTNILAVEHVLDRVDLVHSLMERIEIDLKGKTVRRRPISARSLDFAVINPAYVGKKNRYVYAGMGSPMPKIAGVAKLDLSLSSTTDSGDCTVATRLYGPGCYGGEPAFVPKEINNREEDDGYLVTYVHNENSGESTFLVMDAKSPTLEIIASVKLPQRVPYGFHGIFVPQFHLKNLGIQN